MSATKSYVDSIASGLTVASNNVTLSNITTATGNITLSNAGTLVSGYHSGFGPGLTGDELKELDSLEKEYKETLTTKRIRIFKSMSTEMRQQVVDYLNFKNYLHNIQHPPEDDNDFARMYELRKKDSRISIATDRYWGQGHTYYSEILDYLTEEEIFNAHAEQSLEESLLNAKTDSI
jgi:hypothetical protein